MIAGLVGLLLLLGGGWLWLRDSSLVAIDRVTITGATGPDAAQIREALESAARNMTTLDVRMGQLQNAVAPYPVVRDLHVSTHFPHGITIRVVERNPVGAVLAGGHEIAVAGDGTLLHDLPAAGSLPQIPLRVAPGGRRLTDHDALAALAVLSAAPYPWLGRISQVITAPHGLVAQVRGGPSIYFGDDARLRAKWAAASAVLADPGSAGALYIDVTDPDRPAAGVGSAASSASGTAASGAASAGASSSSSTSGSGSPDVNGAAASGATSAGGTASSSTSGG